MAAKKLELTPEEVKLVLDHRKNGARRAALDAKAAACEHIWTFDCYGSHDTFYKCRRCTAWTTDRKLPDAEGVAYE